MHVRTHAGEKSFACKHCDKKYMSMQSLRSHVRIHTDEKRYKCYHCEERYIYSTSLKNHIRKTHNVGKHRKDHEKKQNCEVRCLYTT